MATHPFAIKLENAIEHAKRVRDALLAAKAKAGEQEKETDRPKKKPHPYRFVQLGAIAASGMERQADVRAGEGLDSYNAKANEPNIDKTLRSLNIALAREESKCAQLRAIAKRDAGRDVQVLCPGVAAARDALRSYVERRYPAVIPNSGGGAGGAF